jgi:serine protease
MKPRKRMTVWLSVGALLSTVVFAAPDSETTTYRGPHDYQAILEEWSRYDTDYKKVQNDEGPFVGGAFDRAIGEAVVVEPTTRYVSQDLILDPASRDTNELIVLLDLDVPGAAEAILGDFSFAGNGSVVENTVTDAVNGGSGRAVEFFAGASGARPLIQESRLDADVRSSLSKDNPKVLLQRYVVVSYPSVGDARSALPQLRLRLGVERVEMNEQVDFSSTPNDPYFAIQPSSAGRYQWGIQAMGLNFMWTNTKGHGHVGLLEGGLPSPVPADLQENLRPQFANFLGSDPATHYHGAHVTGIVSATADNGVGVAGGCPTCSATMFSMILTFANIAAQIDAAADRGMQVINMSFGGQSGCSRGWSPVCTAIAAADARDIILVAAAGNFNKTQPDLPARLSSVLSVGGAQNVNPSAPYLSWASWYYDSGNGSNYAGFDGVVAPARSVVSTVPPSAVYNPLPFANCSDLTPVDESGVSGDGYGSCTGTSMAAPHVAALAGILTSINPRFSNSTIYSLIRSGATHAAAPNAQRGHGFADAIPPIIDAVLGTPNRLTPLFSMYSSGRRDFLSTTVPQMGSAAAWGTLRPANFTGSSYSYAASGGSSITGYGSFPGAPSGGAYSPLSGAWIFATPANPTNISQPLVPLYRLSWKCGDPTPYPPAICSSVPGHMDTVHTADQAGVSAFESWGYQLDGIEGYIYPKTVAQPSGTVRLMRKYNPSRDDHAIFPETLSAFYSSSGYTQNSGSDWLGYVYPNSTGSVPNI